MTQRNVRKLSPDDLWSEWRQDITRIKNDVYELFSSRRTFRNLAKVFRNNKRLQETGSYLWEWMRLSYASYVVMRVRRETDEQGNTINLNQLLREIEQRPDVISRRRYLEMLGLEPGSFLIQVNERYFTDEWTGPDTRRDPSDSGSDFIDPGKIAADRKVLQDAVERVREVANKQVAHRARIDVAALRIPEIDQAFDAIEQTLQRYHTLLHGSWIAQAEPAPQFDTHEVFSFAWIEPTK
jgi:hypothetical protein